MTQNMPPRPRLADFADSLIRGRDGEDASWQAEGACANVPVSADFDPWFPPPSRARGDIYVYARTVCVVDCPVRAQCAEWAITTGEPHGMFGGLTPEQRRLERRRRGLEAAGDAA